MSKQSEIHLVLPLNSHCIRCKLDICEQDLNKKLWIGIYVYKRQYDNKYCEYKPVDVNESIIEFEQLPDGIYEARLFENRYKKLATSKPILIGTPVEVTTEFNYQFPYVINVSYDKCSSHSDWIGLFETSTYSMKKFIKSYSVSIQQNHISVDLSILKIDAMEDGDNDNIIKPKAYEFRYFKKISKISNTTAPSGISKPFIFHNQRLKQRECLFINLIESNVYRNQKTIKVKWSNIHSDVWAAAYPINSTKYITWKGSNQMTTEISLVSKYKDDVKYEVKLFLKTTNSWHSVK